MRHHHGPLSVETHSVLNRRKTVAPFILQIPELPVQGVRKAVHGGLPEPFEDAAKGSDHVFEAGASMALHVRTEGRAIEFVEDLSRGPPLLQRVEGVIKATHDPSGATELLLIDLLGAMPGGRSPHAVRLPGRLGGAGIEAALERYIVRIHGGTSDVTVAPSHDPHPPGAHRGFVAETSHERPATIHSDTFMGVKGSPADPPDDVPETRVTEFLWTVLVDLLVFVIPALLVALLECREIRIPTPRIHLRGTRRPGGR